MEHSENGVGHNVHGVRPSGSPAATFFECVRCGEWNVTRRGFEGDCPGGRRR